MLREGFLCCLLLKKVTFRSEKKKKSRGRREGGKGPPHKSKPIVTTRTIFEDAIKIIRTLYSRYVVLFLSDREPES